MFLEVISLLIAVFYFVIGIFLLQVFYADTFLNYILLSLVCFIFLSFSYYFHYKKQKLIYENLAEIKKLMRDMNNENNHY